MAVTIFYDINDFESKLISSFTDGDRYQLDPCFAAFKRIEQIYARNKIPFDLDANLKLIDKASVRIDLLWIYEYQFRQMSESFRDKEINLIIETLKISYFKQNNISNEDIEFINKISPKKLEIDGDIWTVENIKTLVLVNCTKICVWFENKYL